MEQKTIRTALLGYGFSGSTFFAPFLDQHPRFYLAGALERNSKKFRKDYGYSRSYDRLEEILDDTEIDLVVVNTPIDTHYDLAKRVMQAGKHVIVEKTFTNNAGEAYDLETIAETEGLHLFVYQNRRYDSDFLTARNVLGSGVLGKVMEATISYDIHHPGLRNDGATHTERPGSGGEFNNRGSHITDQALVLFGFPTAVYADFAAFREGSAVEDYVEVILHYPDKRVRLRETNISVQRQDAYVFHGTEGSFFKSRSDMQEELLLSGIRPSADYWGQEPEGQQGKLFLLNRDKPELFVIPTEKGNYYQYFEAVHRAISYGEPAPVTGLEGYYTMLVMDAARESVRKGALVQLERLPRK